MAPHQDFLKLFLGERIEENDSEAAIKQQECPEQECLIPGDPLDNPIAGICTRVKDVVQVDNATNLEPWDDAQKQIHEIAAYLRDVR